jgi:hypothetical protein
MLIIFSFKFNLYKKNMGSINYFHTLETSKPENFATF